MSALLRWLAATTLVAALFTASAPTQAAGKNRAIYSANNSTTLPGVLQRSEGQPPTGDIEVDAAYDAAGDFHDVLQFYWNRDSYDDQGAQLRASVHYSINLCNSAWTGAQAWFGDGNPADGCNSPGRSRDAVIVEFAHALTEKESGLTFSGESGALNVAMSDILAAFVTAWVDGGRTGTLVVSTATWTIGEDVISPALRWMNDPAQDQVSADFRTSMTPSLAPQLGAGIPNLAFYLLSQGGTHPRGRSPIAVAGIGLEKAMRIFYKANTDILTSSSNLASAVNATISAAQQLGYSSADTESVRNAWRAVGVLPPPPPPPGTDVLLTNGVPVSGLTDVMNGQKFFHLDVPAGQASLTFTIAGSSGDADLYVRSGSQPTLTAYNCRPFLSGSVETCTFTAPAAGTWFVMLNAYTAYSGVTLKGTYGAATGDPYLTNGVPVTGISGATSSQKYWRVAVPAGRQFTVRISGGTGDADLYTRSNARPSTATYDCRPFTSGNNEACTHLSHGGEYYILVRGYASYAGVTLTASW